MNSKIAQIIPLLRLKRKLHFFDYGLPADLAARVKIGQLVEIPFRKQIVKGVILNLADKGDSGYDLKMISKIIDPLPFLEPWQIDLLKFVANNYFVSLATALRMFIPEIPKRPKTSAAINKIKFLEAPKADLDTGKFLTAQAPVILRYVNFDSKIKAYLGLIEKTLAQKKQVVIICPQLIHCQKIYQYFGAYRDSCSVLLNDLPKSKYWQEWLKIKKGQTKIILGTRSALFAPFNKLGLIIIDEEDNENHKQEEPNPRYQAKQVALHLGKILTAPFILVSQTPSLAALYKVAKKEWEFFDLDKNKNYPQIKIIDRNEEFKKGNYSFLSEDLLKGIESNLEKKRQVFLFLNRKGLSTAITCRDCGYLALCPVCHLPLTYHQNKYLICHHCGKKQDLFLFCPKCQSPNIKQSGAGTEKVEAEIKKMFPQSRVLLLEQGALPERKNFSGYDIIIGTQYALELIDWQKIFLIGVINADTLLYVPDYKGLEKTFNLLMKLALYISSPQKEFLIQTFLPENYIFSALKKFDWKIFYQKEIAERKALNYPPFAQLIKLIYQSLEFNAGQKEIKGIYEDLARQVKGNLNIIINEPLIVYTQQVRGRFRWQIIIKVLNNADLSFLNDLPEDVIIDVEPESLL